MKYKYDLEVIEFRKVSLNYTDYCTCFYVESDNKVIFYDEIKDKPFDSCIVDNEQEALLIMQAWKANAPSHVICDIV